MLLQDVNGQLYAAPAEAGGLGEEELYDGFGNPLGFPPLLPILGALAPIAAKALPAILPALTGALGLNGAPDDELYGYYGEDADDLWGMGEEDLDGWGGALGEEVLYDGFGNPVGIPALIGPIASVAGGLLGKLFGGRRRRSSGAARVLAARNRALALARARAAASSRAAMMRRAALLRRRRFRPVPPGWRRPVPGQPVPPSRRSYMRCMAWPGVPGLIPMSATPAMLPAAAPRRPRRRRRRRRRRR